MLQQKSRHGVVIVLDDGRLSLKTSDGTVARMTKVLKMGEQIAKYSAAIAIRYGEDRFRDFFAQIRHIRHSQQVPTEIFRLKYMKIGFAP